MARTATKAAGDSFSRAAKYEGFTLWLVGDTPLICHAWSEKARRDMLAAQQRAVVPAKEDRDPELDFVNSLYEMGEDGVYGFPAMAVKKSIIAMAHKDRGIAKTGALGAMSALWITATMVRTRPALSSALCDMPLIRIWGSTPQMREDMVRLNGSTAALAYRAQFTFWALKVKGRYNADVLSLEQLSYLTSDAGVAIGIGDWRNEKSGMFGSFHPATAEEDKAWEAFSIGKGPMPQAYTLMAAE